MWKSLFAIACLALAAIGSAADIAWSHSLDASLQAAKKSGRLVLVDFYTGWSDQCKRMHRETYADPRVVRKAKEFVTVQLDGEKEGRQLARKYGVRGYPETLYLDAAGKLVGRIPGYRPADQFLDDMMRALRAAKDFPAFAERIKKDKLDVEALAGLARIYAFRGDGSAANSMLERAEKSDPENAQGFLAGAMNAVGDYWQMGIRFDEAIPWFRKAAKLGKAPSQVSYARASLAACLYSIGKNDEAIRELEAVIAMPGAPAKDKEDAKTAIEEIKAAGRR
jgi:thioredoxin-like negative regulator of GroEL